MADAKSLYLSKGFQAEGCLTLAVSDAMANHGKGLGRDVKKRGDGIQRQIVHNARTTLQQQFIAFARIGAVKVNVARLKLSEDVVAERVVQLHRFGILT